jgi:hypothetical protein
MVAWQQIFSLIKTISFQNNANFLHPTFLLRLYFDDFLLITAGLKPGAPPEFILGRAEPA